MRITGRRPRTKTMGKPKKTEEPAVDYSQFPDLVEMEFKRLVQEYRAAHVMEETGAEAKKKLKVQIEPLLLLVGQKRVAVDDMMAVQCNGSTASTLSKEKLLEKGVDPAIIAAAIVPGRQYTYIQVIKKEE